MTEASRSIAALDPGFTFDTVAALSASSVVRNVTVTPSMCGPNNFLVSRIGDWTWEAVSHACRLDAFRATGREGRPAYLSFYFYELRGDRSFPLDGLGFGDRIQAVSSCFALGSESVLTVHRLMRAGQAAPVPVTLEEYHERPAAGCLYVINVNRWIARQGDGNDSLCSAAPPAFRFEHLPTAAGHLSPRLVYDRARRDGHFADPSGLSEADRHSFSYEVDWVQDLNGVGLLYFASFFAIADRAAQAVRPRQGRRLLSRRMLYLGNADPGTRLDVATVRRRGPAGTEHLDMTISEADGGRLLAIADLVSEAAS
jgi:probable biosynthetic protein (TIGR04098 family)